MLTSLVMTTAAFAGLVFTPSALGFGNLPLGATLREAPPAAARYPHGLVQLSDRDFTVLQFAPASDGLSEQSLEQLQSLWDIARSEATLREVLVVAYGDSDYPRTPEVQLPRLARQLAERRGALVKRYLTDLGARHVGVYNMAKRPSWLQDWLMTAESQLKREVVGYAVDAGPADAFYQEVGQYLEAEGGPGKLFVVLRKDMVYAH